MTDMIEKKWLEYKKACISDWIPEQVVEKFRDVFYAGCTQMGIMIFQMDDDAMPDSEGANRAVQLLNELHEYALKQSKKDVN